MTPAPWIDIPGEVLDILRLWRPTPLVRATRLEKALVSALVRDGRMEAVAYPQGKIFESAGQFARTEGKVAAPETTHAIRAVVDEALGAKESREERVILFNYSGQGFLDRAAYNDHRNGRLVDETADRAARDRRTLPGLPAGHP